MKLDLEYTPVIHCSMLFQNKAFRQCSFGGSNNFSESFNIFYYTCRSRRARKHRKSLSLCLSGKYRGAKHSEFQFDDLFETFPLYNVCEIRISHFNIIFTLPLDSKSINHDFSFDIHND